MLHYGVWIIALPLIAPLAKQVTGSPSPAAREHKIILGVKSVHWRATPQVFQDWWRQRLLLVFFVVALCGWFFSRLRNNS